MAGYRQGSLKLSSLVSREVARELLAGLQAKLKASPCNNPRYRPAKAEEAVTFIKGIRR